MCTHLQARGWQTSVLPLQRKDWFGVARSLLTWRYWRGECTTDPGYTWYLDQVHAAVLAALEQSQASQVDIIGHSAGGWLARAYLADPRYGGGGVEGPPNPSVRALVTLGTPHSPPPPASGVRDMTGGALGWVNTTYPGAFFLDAGVKYVSVAGVTVVGRRRQPEQKERTLESYAHDSYTQVCGEGEGVEGDAVVPLRSALLEGAQQIQLPGVLHNVSRIGTYDDPSGLPWYGSADVVDRWLWSLVADGSAAANGVVAAEQVDGAAAATAAAASPAP